MQTMCTLNHLNILCFEIVHCTALTWWNWSPSICIDRHQHNDRKWVKKWQIVMPLTMAPASLLYKMEARKGMLDWCEWSVQFLLLHSQQHLQNPKHLGIAVQFPWGRNSLGENVIYYCCHFDANLWHYNTTNLLSIIRIFFSDYILIIFAFIIVNSSSMKVMFYLCPVVFRLISLLAQLFINCWMDFYRM